jgi:hypothetical protein
MIWCGDLALTWTTEESGGVQFPQWAGDFCVLQAPRLVVVLFSPTQVPVQGIPGALCLLVECLNMKLTIHCHLVHMLRIGGAVPPLSMCIFMMCIGNALPYKKYMYQ